MLKFVPQAQLGLLQQKHTAEKPAAVFVQLSAALQDALEHAVMMSCACPLTQEPVFTHTATLTQDATTALNIGILTALQLSAVQQGATLSAVIQFSMAQKNTSLSKASMI